MNLTNFAWKTGPSETLWAEADLGSLLKVDNFRSLDLAGSS